MHQLGHTTPLLAPHWAPHTNSPQGCVAPLLWLVGSVVGMGCALPAGHLLQSDHLLQIQHLLQPWLLLLPSILSSPGTNFSPVSPPAPLSPPIPAFSPAPSSPAPNCVPAKANALTLWLSQGAGALPGPPPLCHLFPAGADTMLDNEVN